MSVQEHNPFKAGDKVKVKAYVLRTYPRAFKNFLPVQYAVVTKVEYNSIFTDVEDTPTHFEHFEFYKEEKEMTQQKQQKTKIVPFTHELWEKWKDMGGKAIYIQTGKQVSQLSYFPNADSRYRYVALIAQGAVPCALLEVNLALEIPITTKRIPFNPELKDAKVFVKVFYGDTEMVEWVQMKSGVVCGSYDAGGFAGVITNLYHPNDLQMEIDE